MNLIDEIARFNDSSKNDSPDTGKLEVPDQTKKHMGVGKHADETKTKISEAQRRRWASIPQFRKDEQARLMNEARRLKAIEEAQPQMVVPTEAVDYYVARGWTLHQFYPDGKRAVLNRPETS